MNGPGWMNNRPAGATGRLRTALLVSFDTRFARFLLVGLSNSFVSFCVFQGLLRLLHEGALAVSLCQLVSYTAGVAWSFFWNSRFTFRSHAPVAKQGLRFAVVQLFMAGASSAGVALCVDVLSWAPTLSWFVIMAPVTIANFLLSRYWVFHSPVSARPGGSNPDAG
jgi:putative flippase GtrA